jgi:hypothetical protein
LRFTPEAFEGLSALILEAVAELAARPPSDHDGGLPLHLGRRVRGEA